MIDVLLILAGVLLVGTLGAVIEYYRQLRKVQVEYKKAKEVIEDIILSINRQLKQEAERVELVAYKVEAALSKSDRALKNVEEAEKRISSVESKINTTIEEKEKLLVKMGEVGKKIRDVVASHETLTAKISAVEEQVKLVSLIPEAKVEAVIPIRREKVLAPLTETELSVLEMLSLEGPKTAPEIKEKIRLSREHTARLMKKLYEDGYLERDTSKIPFRYSAKKEMENLLKKRESQPV